MKKRQQDQPAGNASKEKRRLFRGLAIFAVLFAGAATVMLWPRLPANSTTDNDSANVISPPKIPTEEIDPAITAAIDRDRQAVVNQSESASMWGTLGMTLAAHEFYGPAAECYAQAAVLNDQDPRWPYLHARTMMLSDPRAAVPLLQQAIKLADNDPPAVRLSLCELLLELNELDEAESQLGQYLVVHNDDARARLIEARLSFLRGNYEKCLGQLQGLARFLESGGESLAQHRELLMLFAQTQGRLGQIDAAERTRQAALAASEAAWPDPFQREVRERKTGLKTELVDADRRYGRGDYEASIEQLRKTCTTYPNSQWAKILLARALIRTGAPDSKQSDSAERLTEGERLLNEVLQQDPNSVEALFRLGVTKTYQGMPEESAKFYERAVALKPDFTVAFHNLAHCRLQLSDRAGAIEAARAAVAAEPSYVDAHGLLGQLYMQQGQYREAEEQFDACVRLRPNDARLRRLLSSARRQMQRQEQAP